MNTKGQEEFLTHCNHGLTRINTDFFRQDNRIFSARGVYFGRSFLDVNICESPACVHRSSYDDPQIALRLAEFVISGQW